MDDDNPFEILDLDPRLDMASLTTRLRERAEDLPPDERSEVQGHWQRLTMNAAARARYAFLARPRVARVDDLDDMLKLVREPPAGDVDATMLVEQLEPADLAIPPALELASLPEASLDRPPPLAAHPLVRRHTDGEEPVQ